MTNNNVCKAHSGLESRLKTMENNVHELWSKWDSMQKLMLGSLITLVLNLIGIAFLFITRPDSIPKP
jgi:flagellar biosynthesis/type III secretory pathway M-ring protein FliF/YscJ